MQDGYWKKIEYGQSLAGDNGGGPGVSTDYTSCDAKQWLLEEMLQVDSISAKKYFENC